MTTLNLGCGQNKIPGTINIDVEEKVNPDVVGDFTKLKGLPYEDASVDTVYLFHVIEHIEEFKHASTLFEIWRVLKPRGTFYVSYPEFNKVAKNYLDNKEGRRDFWKATIYGRQLYKSDYHVALMDTHYFRYFLMQMGFSNIEVSEEPHYDYNTVIKCKKGEATKSHEDFIKSEVFGPGIVG
jgi:predicted SAM-dependent methyltransferase